MAASRILFLPVVVLLIYCNPLLIYGFIYDGDHPVFVQSGEVAASSLFGYSVDMIKVNSYLGTRNFQLIAARELVVFCCILTGN